MAWRHGGGRVHVLIVRWAKPPSAFICGFCGGTTGESKAERSQVMPGPHFKGPQVLLGGYRMLSMPGPGC